MQSVYWSRRVKVPRGDEPSPRDDVPGRGAVFEREAVVIVASGS